MGWELTALLIFGLLIFLLVVNVPISLSLMIVILVGYAMNFGLVKGTDHFILSFYQSVAKFSLTSIPLFVLLGALLIESGLAIRCIDGISKWFGFIPARLSFLSVAAGTVFGAISGSSVSSTAVLTSSLYPEMRQQKYSKFMSLGPILASGGLAMIIPPSAMAIVFASLAEISVGAVLIGGLLPGLLMAIGYSTVILIASLINPGSAPKYVKDANESTSGRLKSLFIDVLPVTSIIVLTIVFILFGITTPTESASVGVIVALLLVLLHKKFTWTVLLNSLKSTAETCGMIYFITLAADGFARLLAFNGISQGIISSVTSIGVAPIVTVIGILLTILILGTFLDPVAMMMVTIPLVMPIVTKLGYDPTWIAILMLIAMQIGLTTPPFGLNLFVAKGLIADIKMVDLYKSATPFIISDIAVVTIILIFPAIVLGLPKLMGL